jgi:ribosomal protein S18 acetylase RimI-like enzyme
MSSLLTLQHAQTDAEVAACFDVMQQLRPHLQSPDELVARVTLQRAQGYRLLALKDDERPVALAGYRIADNLVHGHFLYVDDLVTDANARGGGHGEQLIEALREIGREAGCAKLVLDTALSNARAQRFYFRVGLLASGLHFGAALQ